MPVVATTTVPGELLAVIQSSVTTAGPTPGPVTRLRNCTVLAPARDSRTPCAEDVAMPSTSNQPSMVTPLAMDGKPRSRHWRP